MENVRKQVKQLCLGLNVNLMALGELEIIIGKLRNVGEGGLDGLDE